MYMLDIGLLRWWAPLSRMDGRTYGTVGGHRWLDGERSTDVELSVVHLTQTFQRTPQQ